MILLPQFIVYLITILLSIGLGTRHLVATLNRGESSLSGNFNNEVGSNKSPFTIAHWGSTVLTPGQHTSGARSAYPMTPFGDPFSLFNLFNVFRGYKSKLVDDNGNLIPLDEDRSGEQIGNELDRVSIFEDPNQQIQINSGAQGTNLMYATTPKGSKAPPSPVILVPGYGGSRLEAKLDKPNVSRYFCDRKADWTDAWINVRQLLPYVIDCLIDNLRLEYDYSTNTTRNSPGVEIRVKSSRSISSVEYLNDIHISGFAYFAPIINQLMSAYNYTRDVNIRGAPYDFRKAPNELAGYFNDLKETSEQMYLASKETPLTYICHSMGCNNMLYFLQRQSPTWKDKHVRRLISIAAPWGGSLSALRAAALGDDLGMPYLFSESKLLRVQRSLPSTIFLFPHKAAFASSPLIKLNVQKGKRSGQSQVFNRQKQQESSQDEKVYMANDFRSFFEDINHPDGYRMWLDTKDLLGSLEPPGVEVWCLVGRGHRTLGRLEYSGELLQSAGTELYDDGDGTVSIQSAKYCTKWSQQQEQPVYYREFPADHMEALKDARLTEYIEKILQK